MKVARETLLLAAICLADLAYTVYLLVSGHAVEANPILSYYLGHGLGAFVAAKMLLVVGPLAGIEWVRRQKPLYVVRMLRVGIALYVGFYVVGVWRVNAAAASVARAADYPFTATLR